MGDERKKYLIVIIFFILNSMFCKLWIHWFYFRMKTIVEMENWDKKFMFFCEECGRLAFISTLKKTWQIDLREID